jgi:uncharacterized protein (DUF1015 family)
VAEIIPFCALRYNADRYNRDLSPVVAPPYDVLSEEDKRELLEQCSENVVEIDLPHVPPKEAGPDEVYKSAAEQITRWRAAGVLAQEDKPAIYVYHQVYEHGGQQYTRKMFFARLRLEEFGKGSVFPHEQTFGGPKEDRLKLMKASKCQLSAVFGLYSDQANEVSGLLKVDDQQPSATADLEGVANRLWVIQDDNILESVCQKMADKSVYIADGHHRYGTALMYRDALAEQQGGLPDDHPANFVLVGFCAMEDPGAIILPTHRVISGFGNNTTEDVLSALSKGMEMREIEGGGDPEELLPQDSPDDLIVYSAEEGRMFAGRFTNRNILEQMAADHSEAWRNLDLAYLHRFLIDELVTKKVLGGNPPVVDYVKSGGSVLQKARASNGIALICKACTMEELRAVSQAGDLMPQKSTYFYPKLATGLVMNPLA